MAKTTYTDNNLKYADDFRLSDIILYNYKGDALDITDDVITINIYESIDNHTLSGSITFVDQRATVEQFPIIGKEFVEFKVRTPVETETNSEIDFTKHKMYVHNIAAQSIATHRNQIFVLDFISAEAIRSTRKRVSRAFTGSYDKAVSNIFKSEWGIASHKRLYVEPSSENKKVVVPNLRPLDAIEFLSTRALSNYTNTPSFHFYETTRGFHFRSYDSMMKDVENGSPLETEITYELATSDVPNPSNPNNPDMSALFRVYSHEFSNKTDSLEESTDGVFSNTVLAHDTYNKTITKTEFNYAADYYKFPHLENQNVDDEFAVKYSALPLSAADPSEKAMNKYGRYSLYSDFTEGKTMVASNTSNIHNNVMANGYETNRILPYRNHLKRVLDVIKLEMTVPGNTTLNVGQVINVKVPSYAAAVYEHADKRYNIYLSGRYLITDLRHNFDLDQGKHRTIMTVAKETLASPLETSLDQFTFQSTNENRFATQTGDEPEIAEPIVDIKNQTVVPVEQIENKDVPATITKVEELVPDVPVKKPVVKKTAVKKFNPFPPIALTMYYTTGIIEERKQQWRKYKKALVSAQKNKTVSEEEIEYRISMMVHERESILASERIVNLRKQQAEFNGTTFTAKDERDLLKQKDAEALATRQKTLAAEGLTEESLNQKLQAKFKPANKLTNKKSTLEEYKDKAKKGISGIRKG
jgi:hypothetical protein